MLYAQTGAKVVVYQQRPDLEPLLPPLAASMEVIEDQLRASNRLLEIRAAEGTVCSRFMSVPGVGPITALTFTASIEDPRPFSTGCDHEASNNACNSPYFVSIETTGCRSQPFCQATKTI